MRFARQEVALRLGISGFDPQQAEQIRAIVQSMGDGWTLAEHTPLHALLLARGTRPGDPEHSAVLRVAADRKRAPEAGGEPRLEPLWLRKPIRASTLRVALAAAQARIARHR